MSNGRESYTEWQRTLVVQAIAVLQKIDWENMTAGEVLAELAVARAHINELEWDLLLKTQPHAGEE